MSDIEPGRGEAKLKVIKKGSIIIAVKKWNKRRGKVYGPYPKEPDEYYLYEQIEDPKRGTVMRYLGRGKKPPGAIVKEVTGISDFFKTGSSGHLRRRQP